jgi:hypothetical protein
MRVFKLSIYACILMLMYLFAGRCLDDFRYIERMEEVPTYIHTYIPLCELPLCTFEPLLLGRDFGLFTPDICEFLFIGEILCIE